MGMWVRSGAPVGAAGTQLEVQMTRLPKKVLFRIAIAAATLIGKSTFFGNRVI